MRIKEHKRARKLNVSFYKDPIESNEFRVSSAKRSKTVKVQCGKLVHRSIGPLQNSDIIKDETRRRQTDIKITFHPPPKLNLANC